MDGCCHSSLGRAARGTPLGLLTGSKQILGMDFMGEAEVRDAELPWSSWSPGEGMVPPSDNWEFSRENVLTNRPCWHAGHSRRAPPWKREMQRV